MVSRHLSLTRVLLVLAGTGCAGSGSVPDVDAPTAVESLVAAAVSAEREGRLDDAAGSLERALRLEPRDAELWLRLAHVRLAEGRPEQAESLALKAATLAGGEAALEREAWGLIADSREVLGDARGAAEARGRAGP